MTSVADWQNMCPVLGRPREDNLWMLTSGILVISMNAAFGLLEAGCVQSRNVLNILMKNLTDLTLGGFAWWAFGFRIAYAQPNDNWPVSIKDESFWFFHWTFAATASTIDSGTVAPQHGEFSGLLSRSQRMHSSSSYSTLLSDGWSRCTQEKCQSGQRPCK